MAAIQRFSMGVYDYGKSTFVGVPTQPKVINIFIKSIKNGVPEFHEYSLLPAVYKRQQVPLVGIISGIKTMHEARVRSSREQCNKVFNNFIRGSLTLLPPFGNLILMASDKISHHAEEIQGHKLLRGKKDIAGFAIDGEVIQTIPLSKVDYLTKDTANLTDEGRLSILTDYLNHTLKQSGQVQLEKNKPLETVSKVLTATLSALERMRSNERDIDEIDSRVKRITKNKKSLLKGDCKKLDEINQSIDKILQDWIANNKKTLKKPKSEKPV